MDDNGLPVVPENRVKKRKKEDVIKEKKVKGEVHINHSGREVPAKTVGPNCNCKRYQCFDNVCEAARERILKEFYDIPSKKLQDSYLAGLITMQGVKQRRSRKVDNNDDTSSEDENVATYQHAVSFTYKLRLKDEIDSNAKEVKVCRDAFLSIHGLTRARLRHIQNCMSSTAKSPLDKRGQHKNRPKKTPTEVEELIKFHIRSFPVRQSHYSIRKNPMRYYLNESLSIKKLYKLFLQEYRINITYKTYWTIFTSRFNIKFGLPRTDTCTMCDKLNQQIAAMQNAEEVRKLTAEKELHLRKAEAFYSLKRKWKQEARMKNAMVISFDYMQNLLLPHIRTSTVFYASQLWYFVFGIHDLSDDAAAMYVYNESVGKKGQNDVTSNLFHYLRQANISEDTLVVFSDGCSGQNKNYTMIRFMYILVHLLKLFKKILHVFPIRGHSFLPNDQDFSIIGKKKKIVTIETCSGWDEVISSCREKPSPFKVVNVKQDDLFDMKGAVERYFLKTPKPALQLRTIRMYKISREEPHFIQVRDTYKGPWRRSLIRNKVKLPKEFVMKPLYSGPIKIKPNKAKCLLGLCPTLSNKDNTAFYESLCSNSIPTNNIEEGEGRKEEDVDIDSEDNSSGCESE